MSVPRGIQVILRDEEGHYLVRQPNQWSFTRERAEATVFDFQGDGFAEQLKKLTGLPDRKWRAIPVEPRERYETCDDCGQRMMSSKVFFDGKRYLCADCRKTG